MACGPGPWPLRAQIPRDRGSVLYRGRRPDGMILGISARTELKSWF
jgi:hypothetical protein